MSDGVEAGCTCWIDPYCWWMKDQDVSSQLNTDFPIKVFDAECQLLCECVNEATAATICAALNYMAEHTQTANGPCAEHNLPAGFKDNGSL